MSAATPERSPAQCRHKHLASAVPTGERTAKLFFLNDLSHALIFVHARRSMAWRQIRLGKFCRT
jgi:hypothetical protein